MTCHLRPFLCSEVEPYAELVIGMSHLPATEWRDHMGRTIGMFLTYLRSAGYCMLTMIADADAGCRALAYVVWASMLMYLVKALATKA